MRRFLFTLVLVLVPTYAFGVVNLTVIGSTSTQIIVSYTAPDASACTWEVSESASYSPVVNDVSTTLFTNANRDDRVGAISSGTTRIFVMGKRSADVATDTNRYSRALQANTTHYYRVTCGAQTGTGSTATKNPPLGMTYGDPPWPDPSVAGGYIRPTLSTTDRTEKIIDPETGVLFRRMTLTGDVTGQTALGFGGGNQMPCSQAGTTNGGWHCFMPYSGGAASQLYWIHATTGEVRYLGRLAASGYGGGTSQLTYVHWDASDPNVLYAIAQENWLLKGTYTGNDVASAQNTDATVTWVTIPAGATKTATQLVKDYVGAGFDATKFGCSIANVQGTRITGFCPRGGQDSYSWEYVVDIPTAVVIAAMKPWEHVSSRWCAHHAGNKLEDQWVWNTSHQMNSGGTGQGQYLITLVGNVTASETNFTVTSTCPGGFPSCVTGDPVAASADQWLMGVNVGDLFNNAATGETIKIVTKNSPTSYVVSRNYMNSGSFAYNDGTQFLMFCRYVGTPGIATGFEWYWDYVTDPNGTGTIDQYEIMDSNAYAIGGHASGHGGQFIQEEYAVTPGNIPARLGAPGQASAYTVAIDGVFAGVTGPGFGVTYFKYPSFNQLQAIAAEKVWFVDGWQLKGGQYISNGNEATLESGTTQVWKYTNTLGMILGGLHRRIVPTFGSSGTKVLRDISGPGSTITDATNYTFCVALVAGECRASSVANDVYISAGTLVFKTCPTVTENADLCVNDFHPWGLADQQYKLVAGPATGDFTRVLSRQFRFWKLDFAGPHVLPDASWMIYMGYLSTSGHAFLVKLPPWPISDGVTRSSFIGATLSATCPGTCDNAIVWFGYHEQGAPTNYYCTSRAETCAAYQNGVNLTTPFKWTTTESIMGLSCATTCSPTLPAIPQRAIYWIIKYRDAAGNIVATGDSGVCIEAACSSVASPSGAPGSPTNLIISRRGNSR